jgi:hypothetical protein
MEMNAMVLSNQPLAITTPPSHKNMKDQSETFAIERGSCS